MRSVWGALLAVVLAAGCQFEEEQPPFYGPVVEPGVEPGEDPEQPTDEPAGEEPADTRTAPQAPSCGELLTAQKTYQPASDWIDGNTSYEDRRTFEIPGALAVTEGNSGNHCAILELRGYFNLRCHYRGGADLSDPVPTDTSQWQAGFSYQFVACSWRSAGSPCDPEDPSDLGPGDTVRADELVLHVDNGAFRDEDAALYDPTLVHAVVPGRCGESDGDGDGYGGSY